MATEFITKTKAAIAQLTDPSLSVEGIDITNCDREPIHIPSAIQPHGIMLVLSDRGNKREWRIVSVSQNSAQHLGISAKSLLDKPLSQLLNHSQIEQVKSCLDRAFEAVNPLQLEIQAASSVQLFTAVVHRSGEFVILELEPTDKKESVTFFDFHSLVKRSLSLIQQTTDLTKLCQVAVEEVQRITGFDRVMVYRFDKDESGTVVAEIKQPDMPSYLGLRYPATDIPKQAKYLYILNLLRLIPDVHYQPVTMVSVPSLETKATPIDMSLSSLRSVSPVHIEYLVNMGVQASMSVSLVQDNQLWGLLVCHHNTPRSVSYERRTTCEFLAQVIALELRAKVENEDADYKLNLKTIQMSLTKALLQSESLEEGLTRDAQNLLSLTSSTGAAFCSKNQIKLIGHTPKLAEIEAMMTWLGSRFEQGSIYHTAALGEAYPPAQTFESTTSGLVALAISRVQRLYVLWFRPEVLQTVSWAGEPGKLTELGDSGEVYLSPRQSFERWQQTVIGRSLPWKECEVEAALELRTAVIGLVLQKADELSQLNSELERSNVELDSFAYIASHDLKEPLRGIHNYSSFLIEDYGNELGEDGVDKLNTLMRLTQRMEDLISSLLHYSRLGRSDLSIATVDLNEVVSEVVELVGMNNPDNVSVEVPRSLPVVECDRIQIAELFTNLITNAIKYNSKAQKRIEVGYSTETTADPGRMVFYIQDNGIGIRKKHIETIFRIFKRLHAANRFGGGTGAGLTISKKIVERHGGQLWVDSVYGEGSTFYFTLEAAKHG
ncbi:PAS fold family [Synechococcus sp. PCC 7335]|uniref:ATP-binding protein n=1 Tax=Synechococcus sp. (strain ATCC 29403 / PCC 7335) TaxID=91464 RepID=UPI00017EB476|nr:ATP-binding protein [Synechococcus sp. PCC 7335]EDX86632.1 PAS fold family [Synechococcus sp. PCC 7335]